MEIALKLFQHALISLIAFSASLAFPYAHAQDRPDESSAKAHLQSLISGPLASQVRIENFRKTDGLARAIDGAKHYTLEYEATLKFDSNMQVNLDGKAVRTAPPATSSSSLDSFYNTVVASLRPIRAGQTVVVTGAAKYVHYESGWRILEMTLKPTRDSASEAGGNVSTQGSGGNATQSSPAKRYPIIPPRTGSTVYVTRVAVENKTYQPIQMYLDEGTTPIVIGGVRTYTSELEVGSTHLIKVVVDGRVFQQELTVPRVMRRLIVTKQGLSVYGR